MNGKLQQKTLEQYPLNQAGSWSDSKDSKIHLMYSLRALRQNGKTKIITLEKTFEQAFQFN